MHMITQRSRLAVPVAVVLALSSISLLGGCSFHNLVKQATGGKVDIGSKTVPSDFPKEIPLAKGTIVLAGSVKGKDGEVWNITEKVTDGSTLDSIATAITGAGFKEVSEAKTTSKDGGTDAFGNDKYGILVVLTTDGKGVTIANYTVSPATK
jgi:hypothetical protein